MTLQAMVGAIAQTARNKVMKMIDDCRYHLVVAGFTMPDADALRRISMTLHRWHERECGDGDDHGSWCIVRGHKKNGAFEYDDAGKPFMEYIPHSPTSARYTSIPDREAGARGRLAAIMARYPGFTAYVQRDPRGAALYILRPGDAPADSDVNSVYCYTRGIAVYK
jgi:hypothetical protein